MRYVLSPHPLRTFTDSTRLNRAVDRLPGSAVYCRPQSLPFSEIAAQFGCTLYDIDGPHDVMVSDPEALADRLLAISAEASHVTADVARSTSRT